MSKEFIDGFWVIKCDWKDSKTKKQCDKQFFDPSEGSEPDKYFQCGIHHGLIPQKDRPEFKLPKVHKLNEDVLVTNLKEAENE